MAFSLSCSGYFSELDSAIQSKIFGLIGLINIVLGLVTPKSPGIIFRVEPASNVKLIVDKGRSKTGTYQLVFSDNKLVMKKLASTTGVMWHSSLQ